MHGAIAAFVILLASFAVTVPAAYAQNERVNLSGSIGGAIGADNSSAALNVAGGVQLAPLFGVEVELAYMPDQEFERNLFIMPAIFPPLPPASLTTSGRTIAVLGSVVAGRSFGRLRPYAQVGGGVANIEYQIRGGGAGGSVSQNAEPITGPISTVSENAPALGTGGGVEFRIWRRLAAGADVRYMRLFRTDESVDADNLTRFGLRLGYWF